MKNTKLKEKLLVSAKDLKVKMKKFHKTGEANDLNLSFGICWHMQPKRNDTLFATESVLQDYFREWKHYSGNEQYPIASKNKCDFEFGYYNRADNKYEGRQYKMRIKLINHIIKCLKRDIEK